MNAYQNHKLTKEYEKYIIIKRCNDNVKEIKQVISHRCCSESIPRFPQSHSLISVLQHLQRCPIIIKKTLPESISCSWREGSCLGTEMVIYILFSDTLSWNTVQMLTKIQNKYREKTFVILLLPGDFYNSSGGLYEGVLNMIGWQLVARVRVTGGEEGRTETSVWLMPLRDKLCQLMQPSYQRWYAIWVRLGGVLQRQISVVLRLQTTTGAGRHCAKCYRVSSEKMSWEHHL